MVYEIPKQSDEIASVSVVLVSASSFLSFKDSVFTIEPGASEGKAGLYKVYLTVIWKDDNSKQSYEIEFTILAENKFEGVLTEQ